MECKILAILHCVNGGPKIFYLREIRIESNDSIYGTHSVRMGTSDFSMV
jgi:hypothetical protein